MPARARGGADPRNERHQSRNHSVPAGERQSKNADRDGVAAHDLCRLQLLHEIVHRARLFERAGAIGGTGPKTPFDAGMVSAEQRARDEDEGQRPKPEPRRAMGAEPMTRGDNQREKRDWNADVVGNALLQAKVAGRIARVLKGPGAEDRRGGDDEQEKRGAKGGDRLVDIVHHANLYATQKPKTMKNRSSAMNRPKCFSSIALIGSPKLLRSAARMKNRAPRVISAKRMNSAKL